MTHAYATQPRWQGSTADGYGHYPRSHQVTATAGIQVLQLSADPAFRGDASLLNPEQLLLASASSCQLLSFLALAARARIDVRAYADDAEAVMPGDARPMRITEIVLRPRIVVAPGTDPAQVVALVQQAHEQCYIANTLNAEVRLEPVVEQR